MTQDYSNTDNYFQTSDLALTATIALWCPVEAIEYTFEEVLQGERPVVAKDLNEDRGEFVYYLKDREAVAKFLVWDLVFRSFEVDDPVETAEKTIRIAAGGGLEAIRRGNWNWKGFGRMRPPKNVVFQEYIDTPSEFYTSFRLLVDAYCNIHYGTLIRSAQKKGLSTNSIKSVNTL